MKTRFLTLLAAVLLGSISAFAQNTNPVKGDVNEDGTVDVADLVNVIKIMMEGGGAVGEKMCYWYAGTNGGNAVTADNFIDVSSRIPESEVPATGSVTANGQYVYFVMPETKHIKSLTDGNGSAVEFTCTDVMGYHIYKTMDKINGSINYSVAQTVYYWYVGTTKPTSLSQATTVTSYPAEQIYTNNSGAKSHIFVLTNSDKTVTFIEPTTQAIGDQNSVDTTTIPGYNIFETATGIFNTKSIIIRIS